MTSPEEGRDNSVHPLHSAERWNRLSTALRGVVEDVVLHGSGRLDQMYVDYTQATWMSIYHSLEPVEGITSHLQVSEASQTPAGTLPHMPAEATRQVALTERQR